MLSPRRYSSRCSGCTMSLAGSTGHIDSRRKGKGGQGLVAPERRRTIRVRAPRPCAEATTVDVVIDAPIGPAAVPGLWERVCALLEDADVEVIVCDVDAVADPD